MSYVSRPFHVRNEIRNETQNGATSTNVLPDKPVETNWLPVFGFRSKCSVGHQTNLPESASNWPVDDDASDADMPRIVQQNDDSNVAHCDIALLDSHRFHNVKPI